MPISDSIEIDNGSKYIAKLPSAAECRKQHFLLAQRLIDIIANALDDKSELYRYVETLKDGSSTLLDCSVLSALNEERLGRLVKLLGELFEIQRCAIGIPCVKEKNDLHNAQKKLEQERYIADRKLDFELIKLERECPASQNDDSIDSFFRALGTAIDEEVNEEDEAEC